MTPLRFRKKQIRLKLFVSMLIIVLFSGITSTIIGLQVIQKNVLGQAYDMVRSDLDTARYIYNDKITLIDSLIRHVAGLQYIKKAMVSGNRGLITRKLIEVRDELELDILNITDRNGNVIACARNPARFGDNVKDNLFINRTISEAKAFHGTGMVSSQHLNREGDDLAAQAHISVKPTPMARAQQCQEVKDGMVLMATCPILYQGKLIGIIYGCSLLNNNFEFVDRVKELVFKKETIEGYDLGTATIFMDDVRISTNVKYEDGTRATGTMVSEEVYDRVIRDKQTWLDKAFVVNRWYLSGYSPIFDINKKAIGILYVGILEEKFDRMKKNTAINFIIIMMITGFLAIGLSIYILQNIMRPLRSLVKASEKIGAGDYSHRIDISTEDEIGYVCYTFNQMANAIAQRDIKLQENTQKQIQQSERLASVGRLASGIAHEINNPLTGILTYSSLLLEDLKETDFEEDLNVIIRETLRCRNIVRGILDFARSTKLEKRPDNINRIISDVTQILDKHINFHNITIRKHFDPDVPDMNIDVDQMKSVINNLMVNAADAMPDGGTIDLVTDYVRSGDTVKITVSDNGSGISSENIEKIFDPFFTTKDSGKGTGLGLSVTYGIIRRSNGNIEVESTPGEGTTFTITLPIKD